MKFKSDPVWNLTLNRSEFVLLNELFCITLSIGYFSFAEMNIQKLLKTIRMLLVGFIKEF